MALDNNAGAARNKLISIQETAIYICKPTIDVIREFHAKLVRQRPIGNIHTCRRTY